MCIFLSFERAIFKTNIITNNIQLKSITMQKWQRVWYCMLSCVDDTTTKIFQKKRETFIIVVSLCPSWHATSGSVRFGCTLFYVLFIEQLLFNNNVAIFFTKILSLVFGFCEFPNEAFEMFNWKCGKKKKVHLLYYLLTSIEISKSVHYVVCLCVCVCGCIWIF